MPLAQMIGNPILLVIPLLALIAGAIGSRSVSLGCARWIAISLIVVVPAAIIALALRWGLINDVLWVYLAFCFSLGIDLLFRHSHRKVAWCILLGLGAALLAFIWAPWALSS
jgi:hypothetical protein